MQVKALTEAADRTAVKPKRKACIAPGYSATLSHRSSTTSEGLTPAPTVKKAPANLRPPRPHSTRKVAAILPGIPHAAWYVYDEYVAETEVSPRSAPWEEAVVRPRTHLRRSNLPRTLACKKPERNPL